MSTHRNARAEPGTSPGSGLLRRRVIFELTADQLPLLEGAERRHGSKRKALIAALEADTEIDHLRATAENTERTKEKESAGERPAAAQRTKAVDKLERELKDARAKLAERDRELTQLQGNAGEVRDALAEQRDAYALLLEGHERELGELEERVVDHLFCARCGKWAAPEQWAWTRGDDDADYAHHQPCGDHGPGVLGASSWLAHRAPE
jgi:hypothetical protein